MHFLRQRLRRLSVGRKLTAIGVISSMTSLLFACIVLLLVDASLARARVIRDVTTITDIAGNNSAGAMFFAGNGSALVVVFYALYAAMNGLATWLLLSGRI